MQRQTNTYIHLYTRMYMAVEEENENAMPKKVRCTKNFGFDPKKGV